MAGTWTRHGHWVPSGGEIMSGDDLAARPPVAPCGWNDGGPDPTGCVSCCVDAGYTMRDAVHYANVRLPRVGDIVLYRSFGTPNGEYAPQDRAATVTEVDPINSQWVGLVVHNPTGQFYRSLDNGGAHWRPTPVGGSWHWAGER